MKCNIPSEVAQGAVKPTTLFKIFTLDFSELFEVQLALFTTIALFTNHSIRRL
jgi:hypothetical protein